MAFTSIRSSRTRSFLTMLGVVIGVASVVVTVGIADGIKKQVVDQINQFGADVITIKPGKSFDYNPQTGALKTFNPEAQQQFGSYSYTTEFYKLASRSDENSGEFERLSPLRG